MRGRDAGLQQAVADGLQDCGRGAVGLVLAQRPGHESEGVFDLPVGELVRPARPVCGHAEPRLVSFGQRGQRLVHPGQVRGPVIGQGEQHAQE